MVPRGAYSDPQRPPLPHATHYQVLERKLAAIASRLPVPRQIVLYVGHLLTLAHEGARAAQLRNGEYPIIQSSDPRSEGCCAVLFLLAPVNVESSQGLVYNDEQELSYTPRST